jgi:hypothetical protein
MINAIGQQPPIHAQNFLTGCHSNRERERERERIRLLLVHGPSGVDASSSPSPQSTYSPQSSPGESRASPNVSSKQSSATAKFSSNGMSLPGALSSHHSDVAASSTNTRHNGNIAGDEEEGPVRVFLLAEFVLNSLGGGTNGENPNFLPWHTASHSSLAAALQMNTLPLG